MNFEITLSEADKAAFSRQVVEQLAAEICKISPDALRKHCYTVREVAAQIGYSSKTVLRFMTEGRVARNGKIVYLKFIEPTPGNRRVLPADLDRFLANF